MRFKSLAEWLAWQELLHPSEIELGLDRVKTVAQQLPFFKQKNSDKKIITITVGGTNGKGSCVAYLESILLAAGYRVGCFSSPHLLLYNERVRLNGEMISDQVLCDSFEAIDQARGSDSNQVSLTYFEFGTLAALDIFYNAHVDIQILEVGLGGRLDAVNIVEPDAAVVVNVALDHEAWLGDNRETIAVEKAGIFRKGIPLIVGEAEPPLSIKNAAALLGNNKLRIYGQHFSISIDEASGNTDVWNFTGTDSQGKKIQYLSLPKGKLPLPSAACALQVIADLNLADEYAIKQGLRLAYIPGRCQQMEWQGRQIILDVAHNPAGAQYLAKWLHSFLENKSKAKVSVVFSALSDKDHAGIMRELVPLATGWYLAQLPLPRAASLENLFESAARVGAKAQGFDTIAAALQAAQVASQPGETIVIYGSFYTVAEALRYLQLKT